MKPPEPGESAWPFILHAFMLDDLYKPKDVIAKIENPEFDNADFDEDWRLYIPVELTKIWNKLSWDARFIAFCFAIEQMQQDEMNGIIESSNIEKQ